MANEQMSNRDISSINLNDTDSVWVNTGGRSIGYFCQKKPVRVDDLLIQELKNRSAHLNGKNMRLCLHESPDSSFHDMVILERRANYYRPHKHLLKEESYHIIEGSQAVVIFNDNGDIEDTCLLEPGGSLIYRVGSNTYHMVMPISDLIIYHEAKQGPFLGSEDSVFPDWAPNGDDLGEVVKFMEKLIKWF